MNMITPVRTDDASSCKPPGRPTGDRTLEIKVEMEKAVAEGRTQFVMRENEWERGKRSRFASRARTAARLIGKKVRCRRVRDGYVEITMVGK